MSDKESPVPTSYSNHPMDDNEDIDIFIKQLPKALFWDKIELCQWEGIWLTPDIIKTAKILQTTFTVNPDDVLLASPMKSGTTWLKALSLCIMQGKKEEDLLVKDNPHNQVPSIEVINLTKINLLTMPSPRLLHTHLPYRALSDSIKNSDCKIIFIARNPKDILISLWFFFNTIHKRLENPYPLEKAFECFCDGVNLYGPFFDHVLEYWEESKKRPEKILFLKYEDLKKDPKKEVKNLASFLGKPLNEEDLEKVLWKCSYDRLKNLEVNKTGSFAYIASSSFFRKGVVGDSKNYLTREMEERLDKLTSLKLQGSGLEL